LLIPNEENEVSVSFRSYPTTKETQKNIQFFNKQFKEQLLNLKDVMLKEYKEYINLIPGDITYYDELTYMQNIVLHLNRLGYSYSEIAKTIGKAKKAVDNWVHKLNDKGYESIKE
jgi:hypothetical protein